MPQIIIRNLTGAALSVPPPVYATIPNGGTVTKVLPLGVIDDLTISDMVNRGLIRITTAPNPLVPAAIEAAAIGNVTSAVNASVFGATLVPGTKTANAIVVTGQVVDGNGNPVLAATLVYLKSIAVTTAKGAITVTTGTQVVNSSAGKVNDVVVLSNASGVFAASVFDDVAEAVSFMATVNGGQAKLISLAF